MQMQTVPPGHRGYVGATAMTLRVLREGSGLSGLFRGSGLTLLRDGPSFAVYFVAYDVRRPGWMCLPLRLDVPAHAVRCALL